MSLALAEKTRQMKLQTDQANAENQAKTEFLTTISHELRTPMHAVIGVGSLLKTTPLNEQQKGYLEKLETSSRHMMSIIDRVLDLSRLEKDKVLLDKKPFRLEEVLAKLENLISDQAKQKNLSLYLYSHYTKSVVIEGDPVRLSQVLLNLLGNAIKFTDRGYITLLITPVESKHEKEATLTFEVIDTGHGMTLKQQQKLFKPFSQVDRSPSRRYGGFGLGLAISYRLVRQMGGYLQVDSQYGHGSRFFFTLAFPVIASNTPDTRPQRGSPAQSLAGIFILLIDDDEINRFLGFELLQTMGADVHVVDSGLAAIEQIHQHRYDIILADISMPDMDGYETTGRIRQIGYSQEQLPIIALTAHAIAGERERCIQAGMNDYLTKPFETTDLVNMVLYWKARAKHNNKQQ